MSNVVRFDVIPTTVNARLKREMIVSLVTTARQIRGPDYKYNYDYGFKQIGHKILDIKQNSYQWLEPQDVECVIKYVSTTENPIKYANVKVDQSSELHDIKVIAGGIGQNFIEILITARNTYWFKYDVRFYEAFIVCGAEKLNT